MVLIVIYSLSQSVFTYTCRLLLRLNSILHVYGSKYTDRSYGTPQKNM